jgi:hypothetical protein
VRDVFCDMPTDPIENGGDCAGHVAL